jgi:hypothetical protein
MGRERDLPRQISLDRKVPARTWALPSTLAMPESSGGEKTKISFERIVVWPDGHREIEGVTPKQRPAPQQESIGQLMTTRRAACNCGQLSPAPTITVWEESRHPWVCLPPDTPPQRAAKQA